MRMTRTRTSSRLRAIQQASRGTAPMKPARSTRGRRRSCITRAAPRGHRRPQYQSRINIICAGRRANTAAPPRPQCSAPPANTRPCLSARTRTPHLQTNPNSPPSARAHHSGCPHRKEGEYLAGVECFVLGPRILCKESDSLGVLPCSAEASTTELAKIPSSTSPSSSHRVFERYGGAREQARVDGEVEGFGGDAIGGFGAGGWCFGALRVGIMRR
ncbi:hypothetical protein B0H16DRAFT_1703143, partial [Mycena metata]